MGVDLGSARLVVNEYVPKATLPLSLTTSFANALDNSAGGGVPRITSLMVGNTTAGALTVTGEVIDSSADASGFQMWTTVNIPANATLDLLQGGPPFHLGAGYRLRFKASNTGLRLLVSYETPRV